MLQKSWSICFGFIGYWISLNKSFDSLQSCIRGPLGYLHIVSKPAFSNNGTVFSTWRDKKELDEWVQFIFSLVINRFRRISETHFWLLATIQFTPLLLMYMYLDGYSTVKSSQLITGHFAPEFQFVPTHLVYCCTVRGYNRGISSVYTADYLELESKKLVNYFF